jgi:hypothetical protein
VTLSFGQAWAEFQKLPVTVQQLFDEQIPLKAVTAR